MASTSNNSTPAKSDFIDLRKRAVLTQDGLAGSMFFGCALVSLAITAGIVGVLASETLAFFREVPIHKFLFGTEWSPMVEPVAFGVLPLVCGTLLVTLIAGVVAVPLGLACSVYLSEHAGPSTRAWMKPLLDLLAGIPSVVYGFFAATVLTPLLQKILPDLGFFNALSAGLVVGIMILPIVSSLCEESLRAVPTELRQAAYAMGVKKSAVIRDITIPAAFSGIVSAFLLGLSRAIGETMAVTLAAGATPTLTLNPLRSIQTLTAFIAQVSLGDTAEGAVEYRAMFAVGALLFVATFSINVIARKIVKRVRIQYE